MTCSPHGQRRSTPVGPRPAHPPSTLLPHDGPDPWARVAVAACRNHGGYDSAGGRAAPALSWNRNHGGRGRRLGGVDSLRAVVGAARPRVASARAEARPSRRAVRLLGIERHRLGSREWLGTHLRLARWHRELEWHGARATAKSRRCLEARAVRALVEGSRAVRSVQSVEEARRPVAQGPNQKSTGGRLSILTSFDPPRLKILTSIDPPDLGDSQEH